jgi:acetyltransferase-like isoleucine patch superfamily enzyme
MIKKIFWKIEDWIWHFRCVYKFWLHGTYGLASIVERMPFRFTIKYLRKYGATIGDNCIIDSGFKIHRPDRKIPFKNLIIGNNVYIGHNILLDLSDKIIFEDNVAIGANCQIWTHVGDFVNLLKDKNDYSEKIAPVKFSNGVLCYSGVLINPGVTVGLQSRILAFAMVNANIPDKEIWRGIPACFYKSRNI